MIPLQTSDKGAFDLFKIPSNMFSSNASNFNSYLPTSKQQITEGDFNKVMNDFDNFNYFGEFSLNQELDQLYSHFVPKDNITVSRNIQITNLLPEAFIEVMGIIKELGNKVAYIDRQQDSLVTKKITLVFNDLRDAISFYNNIEAISRNLFGLLALHKLTIVYCRDDMAASIFGLKFALDFHKVKFYLTFLAPISKLRESQYMYYLKSFGDLRTTRLIYSDTHITSISVEYFDTRVTLKTSQKLENAIFNDFQMFVSFMQPINNDLGVINFTPFDDEPSFFNHFSGSHSLSLPPFPLSSFTNGTETSSTSTTSTHQHQHQHQQSFIHPSYLHPLSSNLPYFTSLTSSELKQTSSSEFKPTFTTTSTSSSEEEKSNSFPNSYLYEIKPMLRNSSNTLLLSSFTPNFERYNNNNNNNNIRSLTMANYHHTTMANRHHYTTATNNNNSNPFSIQSKPIPLWPFMNNDKKSDVIIPRNSTLKRNSLSSSSFSSFDSGSYYNIDPSSPPVKISHDSICDLNYKNKNNNDNNNDTQEVNVDNIKDGSDTRTTFMIRNIPNKYTLEMLREFLDATNKRTYDFLYLRFDFANKCNAGYAFINFIDSTSVVPFINERVGKIWNKFNSEKLCDISYARIQGKKSLISKFKNSNVMTQNVGFRPIIFYSYGPNIGLEEPFPASRSRQPSLH